MKANDWAKRVSAKRTARGGVDRLATRLISIRIWFPSSQGVRARFVLRLRAAGPGCDLSEEAAVGIGPSALDCRVAPDCPPGPVVLAWARLASRTICL